MRKFIDNPLTFITDKSMIPERRRNVSLVRIDILRILHFARSAIPFEAPQQNEGFRIRHPGDAEEDGEPRMSGTKYDRPAASTSMTTRTSERGKTRQGNIADSEEPAGGVVKRACNGAAYSANSATTTAAMTRRISGM
ncbi:MAG: hypothetical protein R2683_01315 [Bifidobacterium adolescentis]